jgi:uncharacterized membrane protein
MATVRSASFHGYGDVVVPPKPPQPTAPTEEQRRSAIAARAANDVEGGTRWLLIGGIVVAVGVGYLLIRK